MNLEKLAQLRDALAARQFPDDFAFGMEHFSYDRSNIKYADWGALYDRKGKTNVCGTGGCIAGFAVVLFDGIKSFSSMSSPSIRDRAGKLLGEEKQNLKGLFYPPLWHQNAIGHKGYEATPEQAAKAIDNVIKHGEPRWAEVMKETT